MCYERYFRSGKRRNVIQKVRIEDSASGFFWEPDKVISEKV